MRGKNTRFGRGKSGMTSGNVMSGPVTHAPQRRVGDALVEEAGDDRGTRIVGERRPCRVAWVVDHDRHGGAGREGRTRLGVDREAHVLDGRDVVVGLPALLEDGRDRALASDERDVAIEGGKTLDLADHTVRLLTPD